MNRVSKLRRSCRYAKGLQRHLKASHGVSEAAARRESRKPVVCMICQTVLRGPKTAARHKRRYHTNGDYPCKKCGSMEMQYYDLKIHMNIVHGDAYVPTEDDDEETDDEEDENNSDGGNDSELENGRKRKRVNSCPYCHQERFFGCFFSLTELATKLGQA